MRVSFVGCPCSGKTTTAAMVFAQLKEDGVYCEFIQEQARLYIANKRFTLGLKASDKLSLTDEDQVNIMRQQLSMEEMMSTVIGQEQLVINDSSPLNALLYMTDDLRRSKEVQELAEKAVRGTNVLFYVKPVERPSYHDPNRVHSEQESLLIDTSIPSILQDVGCWDRVIALDGAPFVRTRKVISEILSHRLK